ncbi:MAG: hypothetical protein IT427_05385 [Pirellulales bacterium]|nr:hypothetical protein [Pirellulales bacterium]
MGTRFAYYGDNEVYHIVTLDVSDPEKIEAAVAASHHWQTGICTSCNKVPDEDIPNEGWFDEVVRKTEHIFIPTFEGSGYLIWSPC